MERRIVVVTSIAHFISHFNTMVFPAAVLPLAVIMGLSMPDVLGLGFWMYLLFGVTALPWGIAADRLGGRPLLVVMFLGSSLAGIGAAFFATSPMGLLLALSAVGIFSGIYHPIGFGLISKGVNRMTMAMGYNAVCGGLGLVVAPLVTGVAIWLSGPRAAFALIGVVNLLGLLLLFLLPIEEPQAAAHTTGKTCNGALGAFGILLVVMMLGGMAFSGSTVIMPAYVELRCQGIIDALSSSWGSPISGNLVATSATSVIYVVGMVGQYVGGIVGERFKRRYAYFAFHLMCIAPAFLMAGATDMMLVALAAVYFFFQLGMQPLENTLVALYTPRRLHHSAYGIKFVLTFGVGALAVKIIQRIESAWNLEASFVFLGALSVLIVVTIAVLIAYTRRAMADDGAHGALVTEKTA